MTYIARAIQFIGLMACILSISSALNAYSGIYRLLASGIPVLPEQLSQHPASLIPHILIAFSGLVVVEIGQRWYLRLQPNNSFKPNPHRGGA